MNAGSLSSLLQGVSAVTPQSLVMSAVALGLLYLGIARPAPPRSSPATAA